MGYDFKRLGVWEKAHQLTLNIYNVTVDFPKGEQYMLTSQIRRAAVSIPANIAEGCGRGDSQAELARFLQIAMGSATELEYHLLLSRDLKYLEPSRYMELDQSLSEVKRMLASFIQTVRSNI